MTDTCQPSIVADSPEVVCRPLVVDAFIGREGLAPA